MCAMLRAAVAASLVVFACFSTAAEKQDVCVRYQNQIGWSQGYSLQATIISGFDLNAAVNSSTRFKSYMTYAVVFWDKNEATIMELPWGSVGPLFTTVKDQKGRTWQISSNTSACQH